MGQFEQQSSSRKIPREPSMDLGMSSSSLGGTSTAFDAPAGAPELRRVLAVDALEQLIPQHVYE